VRGSEAEPYLDRLLALPDFLMRPAAPVMPGDIAAGLKLTGHFLESRLLAAVHRSVPVERERLVSRMVPR
jgi:DNA repair protein RecO (recombination protein O)